MLPNFPLNNLKHCIYVPGVNLAIIHTEEEYDEKETESLREAPDVTALNVTASHSISSAHRTSQPLLGCKDQRFADNS